MEDETLVKKTRKKRAPNKFNYREHYYKPFGRLIISIKELNNEEKPYILIKHPETHSPVPLLRRKEISVEFRALLNTYLETNMISKQLQKELSDA